MLFTYARLYTRENVKRVLRHVWERAVNISPWKMMRVICIIFRSFRDALCKFITCWFLIVYCQQHWLSELRDTSKEHRKLFCFPRIVQKHKEVELTSRPNSFSLQRNKNWKMKALPISKSRLHLYYI